MKKQILFLGLLVFAFSCKKDQKVILPTTYESILGHWQSEVFSGYLYNISQQDTIYSFNYDPKLSLDFWATDTIFATDGDQYSETATWHYKDSTIYTTLSTKIGGKIIRLDSSTLSFEMLKNYKELGIEYQEWHHYTLKK